MFRHTGWDAFGVALGDAYMDRLNRTEKRKRKKV